MKYHLADNDLENALNDIARLLGNPADLKIIGAGSDQAVIYLDGLIDEMLLQQRLPWNRVTGPSPDRPETVSDWETGILPQIVAALASGQALGFEELRGRRLNLETISVPGWQQRPIEEPSSEQLIRGPREGFTETIAVNTAMIRRWLPDPHLRVEELRSGTRTRTAVRLLYLLDLADPDLVREVRRRIAAIEIDGVLESGYLEQLITDNRFTVFPLLQSTERSDKVTAGILEGRVAILVDKSPFALIVPATINELYQSPEDYYFNFYLGSFLRGFRLLGNNLAVALSGLYVALSSSNPELLPTSFAFAIAESRRGIPYPIFMEVLLLEIMVEVFREAGLRLPKNVNQTLGVVAGIGLALAAVQTHLVSGASLAAVAVGAIASFSSPSFAIGIPWRIFKFILIFGAACLGIVGLTLAGILILTHAATLTSFGVSYLAPWAPGQSRELRDSLFREPLWLRFFRPRTYHSRNRRRMSNTKNEEKNE
jgi:spore germination protein